MMISFSKYSGCGNDFILVDNRPFFLENLQKLAELLCHRQNGIGADGLILLEKSEKADFKMRIFNSDGSEAEMCGNGLRCLAKFIQKQGCKESSFEIETMQRLLKVLITEDEVSINMGDLSEVYWNLCLDNYDLHHLNTGVPHTIIFKENVEKIDVKNEGAKIRYHKEFQPKGTNVNFASIDNKNLVQVRTYERGVEDETLACGTGVTAVAIAAAKIHGLKAPIKLQVKSKDFLTVDFVQKEENFSHILLKGPVTHIFDGQISIDSCFISK